MKIIARGLAIALLPVFFTLAGRAQTTDDVLIVRRVDRLSAFNKYQQQLTDRDSGLLKPFVPMRVLNPNALLGDGFTRCMQVEVNGQQVFLLTEEDGRLRRNGSLGFEKIFRDAALLSDTIQILRGNPAFTPPTGTPKKNLRVGEKLVRCFRTPEGTYCGLSDGSQYGWVNFAALKEGRDWKILRASVSADSISRGIAEKIHSRIGEINRTWSDLFGYFNEQTNQSRPTPSWSVKSTRSSITCVLSGSNPDEFRRSTLYLLKDLENIVLGSGLTVSHLGDRITIQVRQE